MVKTQFSIKDLENLSGIKAHTIRIWEKRYNLLSPIRTETNIRTYSVEHLKKLLNVALLYNEGQKISKIAELDDVAICNLIHSKESKNSFGHAQKALKTAMFDFDLKLFTKTYNTLTEENSIEVIYEQVFLPFLVEIGLLWQNNTIDPTHERFISELIKQKLILNIELAQENFVPTKKTLFSLYLPYHEIHEIPLLFANYLLLSRGFSTIYLGINIPIDSLNHVLKHHHKLTFLTCFTVQPLSLTIPEYLLQFEEVLCANKKCKLWIIGQKARLFGKETHPDFVNFISSLQNFNLELETLE